MPWPLRNPWVPFLEMWQRAVSRAKFRPLGMRMHRSWRVLSSLPSTMGTGTWHALSMSGSRCLSSPAAAREDITISEEAANVCMLAVCVGFDVKFLARGPIAEP